MNEKDVKAILWILKEINNDKKLASYFREECNLRGTDIVILIKWFEEQSKIMNMPSTIPHYTKK